MTSHEVALPTQMPLGYAAQKIEEIVARMGLRITMRGTLAQYPGCIHWHIKRGTEKGTLEITLLNPNRRVLLSIHDNRTGIWTEAALEAIAAELESKTTDPEYKK